VLRVVLGVLAGIVLFWSVLVLVMWVARPRGNALSEALRLLPDLLRLIARLAKDRTLPRGVRVRLGLLAVYLAVPFDLVPDFIPVLGYADDAIIVALTLRSVARRAGVDALRRHWPGTDDGFAALCRLTGVPQTDSAPDPGASGADAPDPGASRADAPEAGRCPPPRPSPGPDATPSDRYARPAGGSTCSCSPQPPRSPSPWPTAGC